MYSIIQLIHTLASFNVAEMNVNVNVYVYDLHFTQTRTGKIVKLSSQQNKVHPNVDVQKTSSL